jgi:hypothetical protein
MIARALAVPISHRLLCRRQQFVALILHIIEGIPIWFREAFEVFPNNFLCVPFPIVRRPFAG